MSSSTDCFECRITGSLSCFGIGCFVLYQVRSARAFYAKRPLSRLAVQSIAAVAFYMAPARWFHLPPFHALAGQPKSEQ